MDEHIEAVQRMQELSLCILSGEMADTKISAENLFSLPICVIMELTKSLPPGGRWHAERDGRSQRDFKFILTLLLRALPQSASLTAPSRREPLDVRNLRGMGFARCLCNTKAKLAIKQNDK